MEEADQDVSGPLDGSTPIPASLSSSTASVCPDHGSLATSSPRPSPSLSSLSSSGSLSTPQSDNGSSSCMSGVRKKLELLYRYRDLLSQGAEVVTTAQHRYVSLVGEANKIAAQLKTSNESGEQDDGESDRQLELFGGAMPNWEEAVAAAAQRLAMETQTDEAHSGFSSQAHNDQAGHELDGLTAADFDDSTFDEGEERLDEEKVPLSTSEIDEGIDDINERYKPGPGRTFPWSKELDESRRDIFRKTTWRPLQEEACNAAMDGKHVIVWMPTAGGKSLCYQLPAILRPGITVVVAPLVALLHDQLAGLEDKCIAAAAIHSGEGVNMMEGLEVEDVLTQPDYNEMRDYRIILVTPERIAQRPAFRDKLKVASGSGRLQRIVIDEVHLFEHADSYRPAYPALVELRRLLPRTPFTFLSATMSHTFMARLRIEFELEEQQTLCLVSQEKRRNLQFSVAHKASATSFLQLAHWIRIAHRNQSGIIYISNIKHADLVVAELKRSAISSTVYHGRLSNSRKQRAAEDWLEEKALVMVATNAFGLGIDKADVRFVCHATLPRSLEDYHQECGRAGRDGQPAECLLWYTPSDVSGMASRIAENGRNFERDFEKFRWMLRYAQTSECRASIVEEYLWKDDNLTTTTNDIPRSSSCPCCDNCERGSADVEDVTLEAWQILTLFQHVRRKGMRSRFTIKQLAELAVGHGRSTRGHQRELGHECIGGEPVKLGIKAAERLVVELIVQKLLKFDPRDRKSYGTTYVQLANLQSSANPLVRASSLEEAKSLKGLVMVAFGPGELRSFTQASNEMGKQAKQAKTKRVSPVKSDPDDQTYNERLEQERFKEDCPSLKRRRSSRIKDQAYLVNLSKR